MSDLISILMPAYKALDTIEFALNSINRSRTPLEIIIAPDDGSDEYVKRLGHLLNVRVLEPTNQIGVARGRNRAFQSSKGNWITTLDADDYVSPKYFDNLLYTVLKNKSHCAYSSTAYTYQRSDDPVIVRQSQQTGNMSVEYYGDFCGSIHSIYEREYWADYEPSVAEDILNEANLLLRFEHAPISSAVYYLVLNKNSVCATTEQERFNEFYKEQKNRFEGRKASVFEKRLRMGILYEQHIIEAQKSKIQPLNYHEFINAVYQSKSKEETIII